MIDLTIYRAATGEILRQITVPDAESIVANIDVDGGEEAIEGNFDGVTHYIDAAGDAAVRPIIPAPSAPNNELEVRWSTVPPGFNARVYDLWTDPPTLLIDTPLTGPDCGLQFTLGYAEFRLELTADFPWIASTWEVET